MKIIAKLFSNILVFFNTSSRLAISYATLEVMSKNNLLGWEVTDPNWMKILNSGIFKILIMTSYKKAVTGMWNL